MFFFKFIISCLSIFISHLTLLTIKGLANILFIFYYPPINQYFFVIFLRTTKNILSPELSRSSSANTLPNYRITDISALFYFRYLSSHPKNSRFHTIEFCGLNTWWPSFSNSTRRASIPRARAAVNACNDCVYGMRKSYSPVMIIIGVSHLSTSLCGEFA